MMINNILLLLIFPSYQGTLAPLKIFCIYFYASFSHVSLCSANCPPPWPLLSGKPCLSLPWVSDTDDGAELTSQGCCFQSSVNSVFRFSNAQCRVIGELTAVVVLLLLPVGKTMPLGCFLPCAGGTQSEEPSPRRAMMKWSLSSWCTST